MPRCALVTGCGDGAMHAAAHALDAGDAHQPADLVAAERHAGPAGGMPHLPHPVHALVPPINVHNLVHEIRFLEFCGTDRARQPAVVGLRGNRHAVRGQHGTDWLDPETSYDYSGLVRALFRALIKVP